jgi:hypothetical protein
VGNTLVNNTHHSKKYFSKKYTSQASYFPGTVQVWKWQSDHGTIKGETSAIDEGHGKVDVGLKERSS